MSIDFGVYVPFVEHLGFTLEKYDDGHSELRFTPLAHHCNSFGAVHGGVLMTLLDVCMAVAARSIRQDLGTVTVEMKTSFMRSAMAQKDGLLTAKGRLLHATGKLAFVEGSVLNVNAELCAQASGTFRYMRRDRAVLSTD